MLGQQFFKIQSKETKDNKLKTERNKTNMIEIMMENTQ